MAGDVASVEDEGAAALARIVPGYWQETSLGRLFVVERRYPLSYRHGALSLRRGRDLDGRQLSTLDPTARLDGVPPERILYLDIETSGHLGSGAASPFLIGVGHFCDGAFRLRQYFQTEEGQEAALLRAFSDCLADFDAVVTFNGATFDLPLLEMRLAVHGLHGRMPPGRGVRELPHLDLLRAARRLYRDRFATCRLEELERRLLRLEREDDVPGARIPALYFRYARTRRFRALLPVFRHNALDVLSLVALAAHLRAAFAGDVLSAEDRYHLARIHEARGEVEAAIAHYRAVLEEGLPPALHQECERRLSLLLRRTGRSEEAAAIWRAVAGRPGNRQLYPYIELAKYYERIARDYALAREVAQAGLTLLERYHLRFGAASAADRAALEARIARLERRSTAPAKRSRGGKRPAGADDPRIEHGL